MVLMAIYMGGHSYVSLSVRDTRNLFVSIGWRGAVISLCIHVGFDSPPLHRETIENA